MTEVGPNGSFALGEPINAIDQGGLQIAFKVHRQRRLASFDFGTVVDWLAGAPPEIIRIAKVVRTETIARFGDLPYDKSKLPVLVRANKAKGVVEIHLPRPMQLLSANPEFWLAYAEVTETCARSMYD